MSRRWRLRVFRSPIAWLCRMIIALLLGVGIIALLWNM